MIAAFTTALAGASAVVVSDYAKGLLTDAVLAAAIRLARAAGRIVVVDPKRRSSAAYRHAGVLTPNAAELRRATGLPVADDDAAATAAARALDEAEADAVLVKRSEKGLTLVRRDRPPLHLPTRAREVADVSGAGDTVSAALALMLAGGAALPDAAVMANVAAGIAVGKPGTAAVGHAELADALHERELRAIDGKVADLETALARIAAWRRAGQRIGFTNGCFDLIHPGHVRLLERARVALRPAGGRAQQRRLGAAAQGPDPAGADRDGAGNRHGVHGCRPTSSCCSTRTRPERLIRAIAPDVLFKGADYTPRPGGRRRPRGGTGRPGGADRPGGRPQHERNDPPHQRGRDARVRQRA